MELPGQIWYTDPSEETHVPVPNRCGACGFFFVGGEALCAFTGKHFARFPFGMQLYQHELHDTATKPWKTCRMPSCADCVRSPESAAVHVECLQIFLSAPGNTLRHFWLAVMAKKPWQGSPILDLDLVPRTDYVNPNGILNGLPLFARLPPELRSNI
ncbi:hypothetical protein O9K51_08066 [Purpureocillium lavendulum]|uniref:CENP-V/GFA domain-containing protein n=1 Tax=Purpureocillium lavendulum TaxID=1247861 RepID=A0AB34FPR6_9HYPO|nr:hypothetical protein O9K51_08066 [Purpureocillium lavendulum]